MVQTITMDPVTTEKTDAINALILETNKKNLEINDAYIGCDYNADYVDGYANFEMLIQITSGKLIGRMQRMQYGLTDNYLPFSVALQDAKFGSGWLVVLQQMALELANYIHYVDNKELAKIVNKQIMLVHDFTRKLVDINAG